MILEEIAEQVGILAALLHGADGLGQAAEVAADRLERIKRKIVAALVRQCPDQWGIEGDTHIG